MSIPFLLLMPLYAQAVPTELVSINAAGSVGNGTSYAGSMSSSGRFVAFWSGATNLVPGDTNAGMDVFVRDRVTSNVVRASVGSQGQEQHWPPPAQLYLYSFGYDFPVPRVSDDGLIVTFTSLAPDLVAGDTNNSWDVFVRDIAAGTTTRISTSALGTEAHGHSGLFTYFTCSLACGTLCYGHNLDMTPDGRFVAFTSHAPDLVQGDANGKSDVFLYDRQSQTLELVSLLPSGLQGAQCYFPSISDDGRFVVFQCQPEVYVRDRLLGSTTIVSVASNGSAGDAISGSWIWFPGPGCADCAPNLRPQGSAISGDGRFVAFQSLARNFAPVTTDYWSNVFVRDLLTGTTTLVSSGYTGLPADNPSTFPEISRDGRYVSFLSGANNLDPLDTSLNIDGFVRDTILARTKIVSVGTSGAPQGMEVYDVDITSDGQQALFSTNAALTPADTSTGRDLYLHGNRGAQFDVLCAGTSGACPCANPGAMDAGCANPADVRGGMLFANGVASVTLDTLALNAARIPPASTILFAQATSGVAPMVFGHGTNCLSGIVSRLEVGTAAFGAAVLGTRADTRISIGGNVPPTGGTRYYQAFYRQPASACTPAAFNVTNAVRVDWIP